MKRTMKDMAAMTTFIKEALSPPISLFEVLMVPDLISRRMEP